MEILDDDFYQDKEQQKLPFRWELMNPINLIATLLMTVPLVLNLFFSFIPYGYSTWMYWSMFIMLPCAIIIVINFFYVLLIMIKYGWRLMNYQKTIRRRIYLNFIMDVIGIISVALF